MTDRYINSLLGTQEKVELVTRQHWFIFFRSIVFELIFAIIIIAGTIAIWSLAWALGWLGFFLLVIPAIGLLQDYLNWSNKKYIITNLRVMQVAGVINKNVTDSSLEKVNDVKLSQSFWGRIFNFGDVEILTASELGINQFKTIGEPVHFKTTMLNAKVALEGSLDHPYNHDAPPQGEDIPSLITQLDRLRQQGVLTPEEFEKKKAELLSKL
ncbi:MAG: PH domain-containing protein [Chloroflexi bacterium]|nr:PH domain-containing protein [Chloroflexota bacterium]